MPTGGIPVFAISLWKYKERKRRGMIMQRQVQIYKRRTKIAAATAIKNKDGK